MLEHSLYYLHTHTEGQFRVSNYPKVQKNIKARQEHTCKVHIEKPSYEDNQVYHPDSEPQVKTEELGQGVTFTVPHILYLPECILMWLPFFLFKSSYITSHCLVLIPPSAATMLHS